MIPSSVVIATKRDRTPVYVSPGHPEYDPIRPAAWVPTMEETTVELELLSEDGLCLRYSLVAVGVEVKAELGHPEDAANRLRAIRDEINRLLGEEE